jgi:hypothetical protein
VQEQAQEARPQRLRGPRAGLPPPSERNGARNSWAAPASPNAAAAPAGAAPAVDVSPVTPAAPAAASAVVAAPPCCRCCRSCSRRNAQGLWQRSGAPGPEAATRAFENEGPSAESDNDEGYGELLQKREEMKKRRAAQNNYVSNRHGNRGQHRCFRACNFCSQTL